MKYSDYLSSYLTPQMTLLEKFNALVKFLDEMKSGTILYSHTFTATALLVDRKIVLINTSNEQIEHTQQKIYENGLKSLKVFLLDGEDNIINFVEMSLNQLNQLVFKNVSGTTIDILTSINSVDSVEKL